MSFDVEAIFFWVITVIVNKFYTYARLSENFLFIPLFVFIKTPTSKLHLIKVSLYTDTPKYVLKDSVVP